MERLEWESGVQERLTSLRLRVGAEIAGRLDLSPGSLELLARLVVADFPPGTDVDEVEARADPRFAEYLTYVGEVWLRAAGSGHWVLWPVLPDREPRQTDGEPWVTRRSALFEWVSERPSLALSGVIHGSANDVTRRLNYFLDDHQ